MVSKLKNNDIVAFSHYIWNKNYNISLAKKLKKNNKNIIIIFGGPDAINDAERRKIERKVERTRKRIEKSQRGEGLNPKVLDMFGTEDKLERLINELDSPQQFTSEDLLRMLSEG